MTKAMSVLFAGLMLVGCATTKPWMSENQYEIFTRDFYVIKQCGESGKLDAATTAQGLNSIKQIINGYQYFPERMNAIFDLRVSENYLPSNNDCNSAAVAIHGYMQKNTTYNQAPQDYQITQPRYTTCNRMGTQTMCTTF